MAGRDEDQGTEAGKKIIKNEEVASVAPRKNGYN